MRRDFWLGLIGVVVLAGCEKPKVEPTEAPVTEAPVQATPPPAVVQATPESAPPSVQGAPKVDDEVYLVRRFSIPIDGGMRGFREGSKVKVVSITGDKVTVAGNDVQFDVQVADISVAPPAVQSAAPKPAVGGTASSAGANPAASASDLEKKKERNRITSEISNLQIAERKTDTAYDQTQMKISQVRTAISNSSGRSSSPESRARSAELERLLLLSAQLKRDAKRIKSETSSLRKQLSELD